jgi:hypothetical protein
MADGAGRARRSKMVIGMLDLLRRDASVRPAGPAPRIPILGRGEDIGCDRGYWLGWWCYRLRCLLFEFERTYA